MWLCSSTICTIETQVCGPFPLGMSLNKQGPQRKPGNYGMAQRSWHPSENTSHETELVRTLILCE